MGTSTAQPSIDTTQVRTVITKFLRTTLILFTPNVISFPVVGDSEWRHPQNIATLLRNRIVNIREFYVGDSCDDYNETAKHDGRGHYKPSWLSHAISVQRAHALSSRDIL
jgi:hypothetical protein